MSAAPKEMFKEDVEAIEAKRRLLEQIVAITHAIEQMQESLNAALILGISSKDIPEQVLSLYTALSKNLRNLPIKKLQEYQKNLELVIRNQLAKILRYSDIDFSNEEAIEILYLSDGVETDSPATMLEDFKRTAQTSVSLKVLLRKRGVPTPGAVLPVPKEEISQQLNNLQQQERNQRDRISSVVKEMQEDVERMIANPAYPEGMKKLLIEVRENLDKDIKHLHAGAPLQSLSFVADTHELTALQDQSDEIEAEIEIPPVGIEREVSFSQTAGRWLKSSWDVSWQDIKNEQSC